MAIIVLREMRRTAVPEIVEVHAAPSDPSVPGDPLDMTFCGKPTRDMETDPYRPSRPGASWLPPDLKLWECHTCARELRKL